MRGSKQDLQLICVGIHTALRALRIIPYMYHQMQHQDCKASGTEGADADSYQWVPELSQI